MTKLERYESYGGNLIDGLKGVGWINLVCSIVCAIFIWFKFGKMDIGSYSDEINPIAVVSGIALIVSGIIVLIIMLSIAHILENSIVTRNKVEETEEIKPVNTFKAESTVKSVKETQDIKNNIKAECQKEPKIKEVIKVEHIKEKPITYAEDLGYSWKCTCGNINDISDESCSKCKSNKNYILSNFSEY
ncbi:hypothetical protein [Clostridium tagluense]|uniref:Uncharacterized protein n=1 Tax=Clostridium tagluense TaxID=360422 RepID=A0A401UPE4_9CLOT|nr:hypothetical protein [Clostridium tagluense]GCD11396.1 hypothetical protein Ctaglu_30190 [Clostridium tagluense]